jgi:hypothetical protein
MSDLNPTRRRNDMRARLTKLAAAVTAVAALAVGGSALAGATQKGSPPAPPAASQSQSEVASSVDGDTVQQGDQSAPDSTSEQAGSESEQAGSESEQASESGPSDGPGGYADTNANADTQQQGEH